MKVGNFILVTFLLSCPWRSQLEGRGLPFFVWLTFYLTKGCLVHAKFVLDPRESFLYFLLFFFFVFVSLTQQASLHFRYVFCDQNIPVYHTFMKLRQSQKEKGKKSKSCGLRNLSR